MGRNKFRVDTGSRVGLGFLSRLGLTSGSRVGQMNSDRAKSLIGQDIREGTGSGTTQNQDQKPDRAREPDRAGEPDWAREIGQGE